MAQFNYYLKSTKNDKETSVYLRITALGKSEILYTGLKVKPSSWCKEKKCVIRTPTTSDANNMNRELSILIHTAKQAVASFGNNKPSPALIKNKILQFINSSEIQNTSKSNLQLDFYQFFEDFLKTKTNKINPKTNKLITNDTLKSSRQTLNLLKNFEKKTRFTVDFDTINMEFYKEFRNYCDNVKNYKTNTFGKHIRNLKGVIIAAEIKGYNVNKEFKCSDFQGTTELTTKIYLSELEIKYFIDLDLSKTPGFEKTRDLFVIGCYTGLRFRDFTELLRASITDTQRIKIKTHKTSQPVTIPILPQIKDTLQKFFNVESGTYDFPRPISNQKFNSQLKEIAKRIPQLYQSVDSFSHINGREVVERHEKWKLVSTHICRRSFATNMYLRGIDVYLIMKITGHKTEREFYKYIRIDPDDSADNFLNQFNQSE
jgi:integrase